MAVLMEGMVLELGSSADLHIAAQQRRRGGRIFRAKLGADVQRDQPGGRPDIECAIALGQKLVDWHRGPGEGEAVFAGEITGACAADSLPWDSGFRSPVRV
jgi:hypothetical protein